MLPNYDKDISSSIPFYSYTVFRTGALILTTYVQTLIPKPKPNNQTSLGIERGDRQPWSQEASRSACCEGLGPTRSLKLIVHRGPFKGSYGSFRKLGVPYFGSL